MQKYLEVYQTAKADLEKANKEFEQASQAPEERKIHLKAMQKRAAKMALKQNAALIKGCAYEALDLNDFKFGIEALIGIDLIEDPATENILFLKLKELKIVLDEFIQKRNRGEFIPKEKVDQFNKLFENFQAGVKKLNEYKEAKNKEAQK